MYKIFIDGQSGTTGLSIFDRLKNRRDISVLKIDEDKRRDPKYRQELINESDITFLCLPDDEARKSVALLFKDNKKTVIIDTSTAHRVDEKFTYGFKELNKNQKDRIKNSQFISNPGCHAIGFISLLNPLTQEGIIKKDANIFSYSITGYSGGGKNMIAEYEEKNRQNYLSAPLPYSLNLNHKHLKEMKKYANLLSEPFFNPVLGDFYSGMAVSIPLFSDMFTKKNSKIEVYEFLKNYYKNEKLINVYFDFEEERLNPTLLSGYDNLNIYVIGNDEKIQIVSIFDNLGKGACGSAIMNMNIVMGIDETLGLEIK